MTSKAKQLFRLERVFSAFKDAVFLTLTTADVVTLSELRKRWRKFRHDYVRHVGKVNYVAVFEVHPNGHGYHVHVVFDRSYLPVQVIRHYSTLAGFGRIHIEKAFDLSKACNYLVKYLSKSIKSCNALGVGRVRLINLSRGLLTLSECVPCGYLHDKILSVVYHRLSYRDFFSGVPNWLLYRHVYNFILFDRFYYSGRDYESLLRVLIL